MNLGRLLSTSLLPGRRELRVLMTEDEWLNSTSIPAMLHAARGRIEDVRLVPYIRVTAGRLWPALDDIWEMLTPRMARPATEDPFWLFAVAEDVSVIATENQTDPDVRAQLRQTQAHLLREVVGNPFRTIQVDPAWWTWNDGAIVKIAIILHDEEGFDRMPILADALEDAGCTDAGMLSHCRGPNQHLRDCWLLDLLLRPTKYEP